MIGAVGLTTRALDEAEPGLELTFPQWRAMLILGARPDGARVGEVAIRVGVTIPATSRLLRRLERRGLTSLGKDEADGRATRVRLTARGEAIRSTILDRRRAALEEIVGRLSAEPGDLQAGIGFIANELERFG
ncbi:MAG: MarR family winged helix-turn-helix transcriptional regulator [bacterium]